MSFLPYALPKALLFQMDAERAHELTIASLTRLQNTPLQCTWAQSRVSDPLTLAGLKLPNRVGLAAGLDKNGACIDGLGAMGFGFVEVGTVTPLPQAGNPKPRMFRLPQQQALINRMGFNNEGLAAFVRHVQTAHSFKRSGGVVGLNIGKNAATPVERALDDYLLALQGVYPHADYVTVNISSPNTQQLRSLQEGDALGHLLGSLMQARAELAQQHGKAVPLFVKIAPDLDAAQIEHIARTLQATGVDGVIACNTTLSRTAVQGLPHADEAGGLSGSPVREASNTVIRALRAHLGAGFPIIGVGGIGCAQDAVDKIAAGADAVQIYTGLVYQGPALVRACAQALLEARP